MMDIKKEKEALIELFGIHFESVYHLPPLASRILGILIIDFSGMTFDMVLEKTGASKSSVSTNLNLLLKLGKINYYTLHGDRKKYFRPAPFSDRLDNYSKALALEKKIIDRVINYREKTAKNPEERLDYDNVKEYKIHVIEMEKLLARTIAKFKDIENKKS